MALHLRRVSLIVRARPLTPGSRRSRPSGRSAGRARPTSARPVGQHKTISAAACAYRCRSRARATRLRLDQSDHGRPVGSESIRRRRCASCDARPDPAAARRLPPPTATPLVLSARTGTGINIVVSASEKKPSRVRFTQTVPQGSFGRDGWGWSLETACPAREHCLEEHRGSADRTGWSLWAVLAGYPIVSVRHRRRTPRSRVEPMQHPGSMTDRPIARPRSVQFSCSTTPTLTSVRSHRVDRCRWRSRPRPIASRAARRCWVQLASPHDAADGRLSALRVTRFVFTVMFGCAGSAAGQTVRSVSTSQPRKCYAADRANGPASILFDLVGSSMTMRRPSRR